MNFANVAYLWGSAEMDYRLCDLGSVPCMMGYFHLAMMSFLALVFTQHHYKNDSW
jgi:hypothetical protein